MVLKVSTLFITMPVLPVTKKQESGVVFTNSGAAITWQSRQKQCVTQYSKDAEYVSAANAVKDAIWLMHLLSELYLNNAWE